MNEQDELRAIEAQIKERLGDIVNKCGIMIVLFKNSDDVKGRHTCEFGNIDAEERIRLMIDVIASHFVEQAQAMAELPDEGATVN